MAVHFESIPEERGAQIISARLSVRIRVAPRILKADALGPRPLKPQTVTPKPHLEGDDPTILRYIP